MNMHTPYARHHAHALLCTAYHEAGHAVAAMLLGRQLYRVEVFSDNTGSVWHASRRGKISEYLACANLRERVSVELLRLWLEEFRIADAGVVAEEEFNLVPREELVNAGMGDVMIKFSLMPDLDDDTFIGAFFLRHVQPWMTYLTEDCRVFFRRPDVSALTRTLAEALLRCRRMDGEEVIEVLLSNRAALTRQQDLFWAPLDESLFLRSQPTRIPHQYKLLSGISNG